MKDRKRVFTGVIAAIVIVAVVIFFFKDAQNAKKNERFSSASFAMSTVIDQKVYGTHAQDAMQEVELALQAFENELSLYREDSDIARINAAAGKEAVTVSEETYHLLAHSKALLSEADGAFALTIAPLTLAWGVVTDSPHVLTQTEIDAILPLVNDDELVLENGTAFLQMAGQAIDLGGIAKGEACSIARKIYEDKGVKSALLSIGGSCVYARGTKPGGEEYRIGFRDPKQTAAASIASFTIKDGVFATSGGYERFFEKDGIRYHHILDPKTGAPAKSDIVSVGVLFEDGAEADFWSTTLFVWGKDKTMEWLKNGGVGMMLDENGNLYVSKVFEKSFELVEKNAGYTVFFV